MRQVEGYLSRKMQEVWPDAVVFKEESEGRTRFWYERPGEEPVGLGTSFRDAKDAIGALRRQRGASDATKQNG